MTLVNVTFMLILDSDDFNYDLDFEFNVILIDDAGGMVN